MNTNNSGNNKHNNRFDIGAETAQPGGVKRTLAGVPAAMLVTAGLGLLMAGMIRVEYQALAEKPKQLNFVINEPVPDIDPRRNTELPVLRRVETPPPPPTIDVPPTGLPTTVVVDFHTDPPEITKPKVKLDPVVISAGDSDPQPILRIPPVPPIKFLEGDKSGRCLVRFDVSAQGSPYNVVATYCSDKVLETATVKSVLKWKFRPKILNGQAVAMTGLKNEVVYQLLDERGKLLPEI